MNALSTTTALQMTDNFRSDNELARSVFFPIFPVIAHQILTKADIDTGFCIDIGSGTGHLAIAIATLSNLTVFALDDSEKAGAIAGANVKQYGLSQRVRPMEGTVNLLPFGTGSVNLAVSRGSFFFWPSLSRGFSECLRVLRPGGLAYIGDGYGNARLQEEVWNQMSKRDPGWQSYQRDLYMRCNPHIIRSALAAAGIFEYELIDNDSGYWIVFRKK
ncbi:MAG: class I SAM-dependent methyltransferase [Methanomicrobiales archaeon]|nr:class I SAM-dependent methyltransferase [Methanomicrobiales archaeon]